MMMMHVLVAELLKISRSGATIAVTTTISTDWLLFSQTSQGLKNRLPTTPFTRHFSTKLNAQKAHAFVESKLLVYLVAKGSENPDENCAKVKQVFYSVAIACSIQWTENFVLSMKSSKYTTIVNITRVA